MKTTTKIALGSRGVNYRHKGGAAYSSFHRIVFAASPTIKIEKTSYCSA